MHSATPSLPLHAATRFHGANVRLGTFRTRPHGCTVVVEGVAADGRPLFTTSGEPDREVIHLASSRDLVAYERYLQLGRGVVRLERAVG